jgi:D-lactate dehydrogenase
MKITFFSAQPYDKIFFNQQNEQFGFELEYFETHLGHILLKQFHIPMQFVFL